MKRLIYFTITLLLCFSCAKNEHLFDQQISAEIGKLEIINSNGFIGATVAGTSFDQTFIVKNTGGLDLTNISVTLSGASEFNYKGGDYPGEGGTCSDTLKTAQSCTIVLTFAPLGTDSYQSQLHFLFKDSLATRSYDFLITADSHPILSFEYGTQYDFGNKFIGTTTTLRIKITNVGKVDAKSLSVPPLTEPYHFKGGSYPGTGGTCGTELNQGDSCEMLVEYSPQTREQHLQNLTLNYLNAGRAETNTLILKGWGFLRSELTFSASSGDDFGDVATGAPHTKIYTIKYIDGDVPASAISFTFNNSNSPFYIYRQYCSTSIRSGTCLLYIAINSDIDGSWNNDLSIRYFNGVEFKTITHHVTAQTRSKPVLNLSTTNLDFGPVSKNSSKDITLTITYSSGGFAASSLYLYIPYGNFKQVSSTCSDTLSSGTCTYTIRFTPTDYADYQTTSAYFHYYDTIAYQKIPLTITGVSNATLTPKYNSLNFGTIATGEHKDSSIYLDYAGGASASNITATISGDNSDLFTFTSGSFPGGSTGCSSTTESDCSLYITYSPTSAGNHSATLSLSYYDGITTQNIDIPLSGSATSPAVLSADDLAFPDTDLFASSSTQYLTITNSSSLRASNFTATLPAGFKYIGGTFPGTGGTCSYYVYSSCTLALTFNPQEVKDYNAPIYLNYFDGSNNQTFSVNLSGHTTTSNNLYLSNFDTLYFPNTFEGYNSITKTITLGHAGGTATASNISISLNSDQFQIINNTCTSSLTSKQSCSIDINFTPTSMGIKQGSLSVSYSIDGTDKIVSRDLQAIALETGKLTFSPTTFDFADRPLNNNYYQTITLNRDSNRNVVLNSASFSDDHFNFKYGTFPGSGGTCKLGELLPSSCTIIIQYRATDYVTTNATLNLNYNNGQELVTASLPLSGTGMHTSNLTFSTISYNFGNIIQTQSKTIILTLRNSGTVDVNNFSVTPLETPFSFSGGDFPGNNGTCSNSLSAGADCNIEVTFAPDTTGDFSQYLTLNYNNEYQDTLSRIRLDGRGIAQAILNFSTPDMYNFGTINSGEDISHLFTITNAGSVQATELSGRFTSNFKFTGDLYPGTNGTCGATLNAGASCYLDVTFYPTNGQSYQGYLYIDYNDGLDQQTATKELQGTGE